MKTEKVAVGQGQGAWTICQRKPNVDGHLFEKRNEANKETSTTAALRKFGMSLAYHDKVEQGCEKENMERRMFQCFTRKWCTDV
jgi:hypothetical protein